MRAAGGRPAHQCARPDRQTMLGAGKRPGSGQLDAVSRFDPGRPGTPGPDIALRWAVQARDDGRATMASRIEDYAIIADTQDGTVRLVDFMAPRMADPDVFPTMARTGPLWPTSRSPRATGCRHAHLESVPPAATKARDPLEALDKTEADWREWAGQCTYRGEWRDPVMRSLLTLKALTYQPSGGTCSNVYPAKESVSLDVRRAFPFRGLRSQETWEPGSWHSGSRWFADTGGNGGSTPPAPTIPTLSRSFADHLVLWCRWPGVLIRYRQLPLPRDWVGPLQPGSGLAPGPSALGPYHQRCQAA